MQVTPIRPFSRLKKIAGSYPAGVRYQARTDGNLFLVEDRALHRLTVDNGVRIEFLGADDRATVIGEEMAAGQVHYLAGVLGSGTSAVHARTFGRVRTRGLYPGVDLVVYFRGNQVEFDFELAPGARMDRVKMLVTGSGAWRINESGALELGGIQLLAPVAYQDSAVG
jgi:hypothetical protein